MKVLKSLPNGHQIIDFDQDYKKYFIEYNTRWIKEMFWIEQDDIDIFNSVDKLIEEGNKIFFNIDKDGTFLSTALFMNMGNDTYEFCKFASNYDVNHKGAGTELLVFMIDYAKNIGVKKITIITNTICEAAIHLYLKHGFVNKEIPLEYQNFQRGNYYLELIL